MCRVVRDREEEEYFGDDELQKARQDLGVSCGAGSRKGRMLW